MNEVVVTSQLNDEIDKIKKGDYSTYYNFYNETVQYLFGIITMYVQNQESANQITNDLYVNIYATIAAELGDNMQFYIWAGNKAQQMAAAYMQQMTAPQEQMAMQQMTVPQEQMTMQQQMTAPQQSSNLSTLENAQTLHNTSRPTSTLKKEETGKYIPGVTATQRLNNMVSPFAAIISLLALPFSFVKGFPVFGDVSLKKMCDNISALLKHSSDGPEIFGKICSALFILVIVNSVIHIVDTFKKVTVLKVIGDVLTLCSFLCMTISYIGAVESYGDKFHFGPGWILTIAGILISFVSFKVGVREELSYTEGPRIKWKCPNCGKKNVNPECSVCGTAMDRRYEI